MLFLTGTHISVPALTGAIMCMGVATANSILVVSFAKEQMEAGLSAADAALTAGFTRFRPVIMTALAMIIGMVPMALGLGDGGEQNAPLGRAVIGGLLLATFGTLPLFRSFFPLCTATIRRSQDQPGDGMRSRHERPWSNESNRIGSRWRARRAVMNAEESNRIDRPAERGSHGTGATEA